MAGLKDLKAAITFNQVAHVLGYQPKALSYILHRSPTHSRYSVFTIPKKSGGSRTITAPSDRLKLLQSRLAETLYLCQSEIHAASGRTNTVSHGFEKGKSILTNAWEHKNKRFVLNIDLEDFFPSINFGRVYGYFMKDRNFLLHKSAATILAQIACYNDQLPQRSPCSPIISNLIGNILDVRLTKLAKASQCHYTRYADDITFSTNAKNFPPSMAMEVPGTAGDWILGASLVDRIQRAGFRINNGKTRMQCRTGRQIVTGLSVNDKVNIRAEYYRQTRSKCHSLFLTGSFHMGASPAPPSAPIPTTAHLEGVLAHIYHIKHQSDERSGRLATAKAIKDNRAAYPAYRELYKKFLYFKRFIILDKPLIVCEGKTDNIYLRCALKGLAAFYPNLCVVPPKTFETKVRLLKHGSTEHDLLELAGGSSKLATFVGRYTKTIIRYDHRPIQYPVIVLIDNDSGAADVFSAAKGLCKPPPTLKSYQDFYFAGYNLYIVKTPENLPGGTSSCIEDLFDAKLLSTKLGGKTFDKSNDLDTAHHYGKWAFADRVVRPAVASADFSGFVPLFNRIEAVLADYAARSKVTP